MTAEQLSALAGAAIAFLFRLPGIEDRYQQFSPDVKQWIMLGVLLLTAVSLMILACTGFGEDLGLTLTCDRSGLITLLTAFIYAVIGNQSAYSMTRYIGR